MPATRRPWTALVIATLLFSTGLPSASAEPSASLSATRITEANAALLVQQGPDAAGGIGDWHLSDGTLCAIISAVEHESDLSARGGALIDLGYCDRDDDQFVVTQDLRDGSAASPINMYRVEARLGAERAAIVATGGGHGLVQETHYRFDRAHPGQLRISKRIWRTHDDAPGFRLLVPVLFNYHSMETFLLSSSRPEYATGFAQVGFSSEGVSAFTEAARKGDTIVALGAPDSAVPVSYGWRLLSARKRTADGQQWQTLPSFIAADAIASVFLILADPFFVGGDTDLGLTQMLQIALMGLEVGEELQIEEVLYVGKRSDVATITDQLYPDAPLHKGTVSVGPAGSSTVHVARKGDTEQWHPFSFVVPDADGSYQLRLPTGDYQLTARAPAGLTATAQASIGSAPTTLPDLTLPASATLGLPRGEAMRLVFKGENGTPDPDLQSPLTGYEVTVDGERISAPPVSMVFLAGTESDRRTIALPPGDYRVFATRGIEYGVTETTVTMVSGEHQRLDIALPLQQVPTPGYLAADLHVHAGPSMDNGFAPRERVRTFVAEHGEVMVATEHETLFDFAPLLRDMQVDTRMVSITGTEMTGQVRTARMPHTAGHANFFPLTPDPTAFRRGVPANEDRRLREILYSVRSRQPEVFAQLNHTRGSDTFRADPPGADVRDRIDDGAYFDHMGPAAYPYDPTQPLTSAPNRTLIEPDPVTGIRDLDVDAMEILNGAHDYSPTRRRALMRDWLSLLLQGERLTGTANSDSHGKGQQVALPRNMVAVANERIDQFDERAFIAALRAGRSYGTTGPLLEVDLSGAGLGEMISGSGAELTVRVRTADWVPAQTLRVRVNGEVVATIDISTDRVQTLPLTFQTDSFVMVEVEAEPGARYQIVLPGHRPYAFSNPIYVDANADGRWQPPGL